MIGINFDTGEFEASFSRTLEDIEAAAKRGVGKAMLALAEDAINDEPMVPLEEGTLRGSVSVFVQGELIHSGPIASGQGASGAVGTPGLVYDEPLDDNKITGAVGFNTPYAGYQHEGVRKDGTRPVKNYTHPGTGKKFLSLKEEANADDYAQIVADEINGRS